jgi:hypothetical protein
MADFFLLSNACRLSVRKQRVSDYKKKPVVDRCDPGQAGSGEF